MPPPALPPNRQSPSDDPVEQDDAPPPQVVAPTPLPKTAPLLTTPAHALTANISAVPDTTVRLQHLTPGEPQTLLDRAVSSRAFPERAMFTAIEMRLRTYLEPRGGMREFEPHKEWDYVADGKLHETELLIAYTLASGIPVLDDDALPPHLAPFPGLAPSPCRRLDCLPVDWNTDVVVLLIPTPYDLDAMSAEWQALTGREPRYLLGRRSLIDSLILLHYP